MEVTSLGYRTDLALLRLGGSDIEDHDDHIVVRSVHNPDHWWGNFVLLLAPPAADDADRWLTRFAEVFPGAQHRTLGFDGAGGTVADLAPFADRGLAVEASAVMTARTVHLPAHRDDTASYRQLSSDEEWSQSVALRVACSTDQDLVMYATFAERKVASNRAMAEAGHGGWFGAFLDGRLVSQLGLYAAGRGVARYQSVETHPDFRGRGLAGTLVHHAGRFGFDQLAAHTLVIVADPDYLAVRVYRGVGFAHSQTQLQAERRPLPAA